MPATSSYVVGGGWDSPSETGIEDHETEYRKGTSGGVHRPADVYSRDCPSRVVLDRIVDRSTATISAFSRRPAPVQRDDDRDAEAVDHLRC